MTVGDVWDLAAARSDGHEVLDHLYDWRHAAQAGRASALIAAGIALATAVVVPFIAGDIERTDVSALFGAAAIGLSVTLIGFGITAFIPLARVRHEYVIASRLFGILKRAMN